MAALTSPGDRHALLITGESGAGKTEAARAVLSFVATRHGPTDHMCDRLLRSTPVLEAFGNAHTRQNTNSSRFGKFIEVHLAPDFQVVGATLQPYMLEASRVSGDLPQGERTYHVFYLLRAALAALAAGSTPQGHFWTRLSHAPEWMDLARVASTALAASPRLDNGPPADRCMEWFEALHEGLVKIGMRHGEVAECCRIVAAVSSLADMEAGDSALTTAAVLLRISEDELRSFLSKVEMSVGTHRRERLCRTRSEREATTLRASFAQELYTALFGWLTRLVARGIAPPTQDGHKRRALGLLDLYGFEVFSTNGFEQFLINYCNERLQQFFNRQVFTMEAEEYAAEGLDSDGQWRRLVEACQLPALDLLEGSNGNVGVFGLINDRSRCGFEDTKQDGGGSALAQAIVTSCGHHSAFRPAARDYSRVFGVAHFAG
jgi:myosin-5